jgi:L-iditol 2-dehydrogenase
MDGLMEAAVLYAPGDLRIERVSVPVVGEGEALVRVKAVGICGSDLDRVMKRGTYSFPMIPGHEFCGVIEEVRCGVDISGSARGWKRGDRVVVSPLMPCFQCEPCQRGDFGQCDHYDYLGSRTDGAFAQFVKAPIRNLLLLPDSVSFEEGAVVEPTAVVLHGIRRVGIGTGDSVAVLGCGTLGLLALQLARVRGATAVIAADIDSEKLRVARELGADETVDASKVDTVETVRALTQGGGACVCIETAGVSRTQEECLRITRKQGRVLFLGTAHGEVRIPPESFECILRGELTLYGSWNSYSAPFPGLEWSTAIDYLEKGSLKIRPLITHTLSLADAPQTFQELYERKYSSVKVLFVMQ